MDKCLICKNDLTNDCHYIWDMNSDFVHEITKNEHFCWMMEHGICKVCYKKYKNNCSKTNCIYSWREILRHVECVNILETRYNWLKLQKEIKQFILSLVLPPEMDLYRHCTSCKKIFCNEHEEIVEHYFNYWDCYYNTTCIECCDFSDDDHMTRCIGCNLFLKK